MGCGPPEQYARDGSRAPKGAALMYLASRRSIAVEGERGEALLPGIDPELAPEHVVLDGEAVPAPSAARTGVEGNVVALGVTSLFTDVSSEMVASVLPLYLTILYGFSPLQLGIFDGFYQGLAAIFALW